MHEVVVACSVTICASFVTVLSISGAETLHTLRQLNILKIVNIRSFTK